MKAIKFITHFFTSWKNPIFLFGAGLALTICSILFTTNVTLQSIAFYFFIFSIVPIILSIIYQLIKRQFSRAILTLFALGIGAVVFVLSCFWSEHFMPDKYADNLTIPTNIKIDLPSDSTISFADTATGFHLYNSFQPGLYSYSISLKKIEKGYCYLRAFEITHNDPLSVDDLKQESRIEVQNESDTLVMFAMAKDNLRKEFTIFEGDWDKPYAARFEVWFVPANGNQERKLMEKNFKIEGWMQ